MQRRGVVKRTSEWVSRNQRHLSAVVFIGSFIVDNLTLGAMSLSLIAIVLEAYLIIAALAIFLVHFRMGRQAEGKKKTSRVPLDAIIMLIGQFFLGGLLSGCFILYSRSAYIWVSWPFIILLAVVFFGSEFLHKYKEQLTFQCSLLFFGLYAYAVFALPVATKSMSGKIFLASGALSALFFVAFVGLLWYVNKRRMMESARQLAVSITSILVVINLAYFLGILPPLPLSLRDSGIYHNVTHVGDVYAVEAEPGTDSIWPWVQQTVHVLPGDQIYAYSAVFAPVQLTTGIVHQWEWYDTQTHNWATKARIEFPISGGRDNGYRGYSEVVNPEAGSWRLSIETATGQVIGRESFTVVAASSESSVVLEQK